jgi:tRNA A37 threonylcarbamoyladenosine synthetase subunit TsaC/SUA5/YrdC
VLQHRPAGGIERRPYLANRSWKIAYRIPRRIQQKSLAAQFHRPIASCSAPRTSARRSAGFHIPVK